MKREAIRSMTEFLNEFCPYEADELIEEYSELLEENPKKLMEYIEEYDTEIGKDLKDIYDDMYDTVYEYCICLEDF